MKTKKSSSESKSSKSGPRGSSSSGAARASESDDQNSDQANSSLQQAFLEEVADILDAEQQLTEALPKMADAAVSPELKEAITSHLEETKEHVERIEEAMDAIGESVAPKTCEAMKGLLREAEEMMETHKGKASLDAVLIAGAQKVEHYEIATYGTLVAWATQLGHEEAADLFTDTLNEEKSADETLTQIAESSANTEAGQSHEEEE